MDKLRPPYNTQLIGKDETSAVADPLRADFLTTRAITEGFEEGLASCLGVKFAIVCSDETAASHLSLQCPDESPRDAVISTPNTFLADANEARFSRADIVFADVESENLNLSPSSVHWELEKHNNVKALIVAHYGGNLALMEDFQLLSNEFGASIIEDSCHAKGGHYKHQEGTIKFVAVDIH